MKLQRSSLFVVTILAGSAFLLLVDYGNLLQFESTTALFRESPMSVAELPQKDDKIGKESSLSSNTLDRSVKLSTDTATTMENNSNNKAEPPMLILHVGPRKTGTSSVQKFSRAHKGQLQKENMYYLGHFGRFYETNFHLLSLLCLQCKEKSGDCGCEKRWQDFKSLVDSHYEEGHNVFISDETLNRFFDAGKEDFLWTHLEPILNRGWRVRLVFTYRRYHSFIPSSYIQSFHPHGKQQRERRQKWPDQGGRVIPSFSQYAEKFTTRTSKQPDWIKSMWEERFPGKVKVFNMHETGDYVTNFFCQMVPEAERMCRRLKGNEITDKSHMTMNSSANKDVLHFDMIATTAYAQGLVDKSYSRPDVADAVEKHALNLGLKSPSDFPLECLDKLQAERLLNITLDLESKLVPEFFVSPDGAGRIRSDLMEASHKGVFCSIDSSTTLQDPRWQQFFENYLSETHMEIYCNTCTK